MKELIAYCGLDCEKCDARLATINNDDELREKVAKLWTDLNQVEITKEMINCMGCKGDGVKTPFCDSMCPIRQCAMVKNQEACAKCNEFTACEKIKMITENNDF